MREASIVQIEAKHEMELNFYGCSVLRSDHSNISLAKCCANSRISAAILSSLVAL